MTAQPDTLQACTPAGWPELPEVEEVGPDYPGPPAWGIDPSVHFSDGVSVRFDGYVRRLHDPGPSPEPFLRFDGPRRSTDFSPLAPTNVYAILARKALIEKVGIPARYFGDSLRWAELPSAESVRRALREATPSWPPANNPEEDAPCPS